MFNKKLLLSAVLCSALSANAGAAALNADGQWHPFDVDDTVSASAGLEWIDLDGDALSFDFTLTGSAILRIVDGGFAGDRFDVFNGKLPLGQTSAATNNYPESLGLDFDAAFADGRYSRSVFLLGPGSYSINGLLSLSALDDNAGAINATVGAISLTAVPLPAAAWLYLAGAGLMATIARRRQSNT